MTSCRPLTLATIVGAVVALAASSASALPSIQFHRTDATYVTSFSQVVNQGTVQLLRVVGSGRFVSTSDVILEGAHYLVSTLASQQNFLNLNAKGEGKIRDDRWKHKQFEKVDADPAPASDLPEPPTVWMFGAGLALMIVLVLLRRRRAN